MKVWLIGENNPYSQNPSNDLYPYPPQSAGSRLACMVLEQRVGSALEASQIVAYCERFTRRNLLRQPKWSLPAARAAAQALAEESAGAPLVLLGAKVAEAFGVPYKPFELYRLQEAVGNHKEWRNSVAVLPHPSGLCRAWAEPGSYERARATVVLMEGMIPSDDSTPGLDATEQIIDAEMRREWNKYK